MYAFFLLVLLADCARVHASVPAGGDAAGNLILNAASSFEVTPAGDAILVLRHADGSSSCVATFNQEGLRFSVWSATASGSAHSSGNAHRAATWRGNYNAAMEAGYLPAASETPLSLALTLGQYAGSPAP